MEEPPADGFVALVEESSRHSLQTGRTAPEEPRSPVAAGWEGGSARGQRASGRAWGCRGCDLRTLNPPGRPGAWPGVRTRKQSPPPSTGRHFGHKGGAGTGPRQEGDRARLRHRHRNSQWPPMQPQGSALGFLRPGVSEASAPPSPQFSHLLNGAQCPSVAAHA